MCKLAVTRNYHVIIAGLSVTSVQERCKPCTPVKRESSAHISTYTPVVFMTSSKWRRPLDAEQSTCHNAGIVTTCLLKLLYKHHATCALLAIQNQRYILRQESSNESDGVITNVIIQTTRCPKILLLLGILTA